MLSKSRPFIGVILILVVAAGVAWWSSKAEAKITNHIHKEVTKLVPLFMNNPSAIDKFVVNDVLQSTLERSLKQVCEMSAEGGGGFSVVVTNGDTEEYGDGTATHVAVFQINSKPVAGLRIICSSQTDPLLIAGAWIK
jgi:hypothetical protein|tara:strand:+ start:186 stop:599 length:414 start_codon:yes stop_codon:yes gene_type:complete